MNHAPTDIETANPIRKQRLIAVAGIGRADLRVAGYFYAVCPQCAEILIPTHLEGIRTRKAAKDKLHRHTMKEHAGPGGDSTSSNA